MSQQQQQEQHHQQQQHQWSIVVPNTARKGIRGNIHRWVDGTVGHTLDNQNISNKSNYGPYLSLYGCRTLYETIRYGATINPLGPCLGYRAISSNTGYGTPYIYISYTETISRINCIAAGLHCMKLLSRNNDNMLLLGLYVKNCVEWVLGEHAIYTLGGATVPLYDTLGIDVVQYILNHTEMTTVLCSQNEVINLCNAKKSGVCSKFQYVIVIDGITENLLQVATECNLILLSLAKVETMGSKFISTNGGPNKASTLYHNPPSSKDIVTICYTSGTTGTPKGVLLIHENLISAAVGTIVGTPLLEFTITDRHISYLPLPHIFERMVQTTVLVSGASIAFYCGNPLQLFDDIITCQPTLLPIVPRVCNKIYDKIQSGIAATGGIKKKLFDHAVAVKTYNLLNYGQLTHTLYDALIFNKIKKALGFQYIKGMISGSAPLSDTVMIFFRILLSVPILEGYGQTEGSAAATISHPYDVATVGHVGGPTPTTEIALYDVPEMKYISTDTHHLGKPCYGRGEICIRGPNVFVGYYKDITNTNETIDTEGWLHSGDIGLWRVDGTLQIIDRKKNIFKLSQGEYVAPEKIENILLRSPYIGQVFVHGDSQQSRLVAIIVPDEDIAKQWFTTTNNTTNERTSTIFNFEKVCTDEQFHTIVLQSIQQISKDAKLNGFETVAAIHISHIPFSVENELLTPTFKVKRQQARDMYQQQLDQLYTQLSKQSKL